MAVAHVGGKEFEKQVLGSKIPVLVDFYTEWCPPCREMAPILEKLEAEMKGKVKIVKVDIEDERELAENYEVENIPTFIIFKGGKEISRDRGMHPRELMKMWLEQVV